MSATTERVHTALRIPADALELIDQQARAHNLSRTAYMVSASTGKLPTSKGDLLHRIDQLEQRLKRLEGATFG